MTCRKTQVGELLIKFGERNQYHILAYHYVGDRLKCHQNAEKCHKRIFLVTGCDVGEPVCWVIFCCVLVNSIFGLFWKQGSFAMSMSFFMHSVSLILFVSCPEKLMTRPWNRDNKKWIHQIVNTTTKTENGCQGGQTCVQYVFGK